MDNRTRFRLLLEQHSITQDKAAEMVAFATKRPCSVRAVRSWLASDDAKSKRPCPDWALAALQKVIATIQKYNAQREAEEKAKAEAADRSEAQ